VKAGDKITIKWNGLTVPGWVHLASPNGASLWVRYDYMEHEHMIAGHIGGIPVLRQGDGTYRTLFGNEPIEIEAAS